MKVNISGTMTKDTAPDNGLDGEVGDKMHANPMARIAVTGLIELHGYHRVKGKPEYVSARFVAIEAAQGDDDITVRNILDESRKARGLGPTSLTLFDTPADDDGAAKGPWPGDVDFIAGDQGTLDDAAYELSKVRPQDSAGEQDDAGTAAEEAEKEAAATAARNTPMGGGRKTTKRGGLKAVDSQ